MQFAKGDSFEADFWRIICRGWSATVLAALFFISGYLMESGFDSTAYWGKIKRRLPRLAFPYVVWNFLFVLVYLILSLFSAEYSSRVEAQGLNTISGCFSRVFCLFDAPLDGPLWFIRTLLLFAIIFPAWHWLIERWHGLLCMAVVLGWSIISHFLGVEDDLVFSFPSYAIISFSLGACFNCHKVPFEKVTNRVVLFLALGILIVRSCVVALHWELGIWFRNLSFVMMVPVWAMMGMKLGEWFGASRVFVRMKDVSYFVYACHVLICPLFSHGIAWLLPRQFPGRISILIFGYVVGGCLCCLVLNNVLSKLFPRIALLLNGELKWNMR